MTKIALSLAAAAATVLFVLCTAPAQAFDPIRTWVSATGSNAYTATECSLATNPCNDFATALSQTTANGVGGEVNCIGPAGDIAGGGSVTITISVTIDCHGTFAGFITGFPNAFVINAPGDVVTIRGLNIDGTNGPNFGGLRGANGVVIEAAAVVNIEDCVIENFTQSGISVTTSANTILNVRNSTIRNAANGISFAPTGGAVNGSIDRTMIAKMSGNGITTNGGTVFFTVTSSVIANAAGVGVHSDGAGTVLGIDSSSVSNNRTAFATAGGVIRISRNVIYDNTTNYSIAGGVIATAGNNSVAVNGSTVPNGSVTQQ
jgi:hypothetical protein